MHDVQRSYDEPFIQVPSPDLIYMMQNCKPTTVCVYLALLIRSNRKRGNTCFPSYNTIAEDAGVSRRTAITALEELQEHGFVTVEQRMDEEGDQTSNMYWLHLVRAKSAQGGENPAPPLVQNLHHRVVQNLHPNHKNLSEPEELEQDNAQRKTRKATQIQEPFGVDDTTYAWAREEGFTDSQVFTEQMKFVDHHAAKGSKFVDWQRAFKNWLRNSKEWGRTTTSHSQRKPEYIDKHGNYTVEGSLARARGEI